MKKILTAALLLLAVLPLRGQKYDGVIDKSVALIGNDIVMLSEIEAEAQMERARGLAVDKTARCEILENFLVSKLFLTQARLDSLVVNDAQVSAMLEQRMNEVVMTLGGEQKTEEYFGKPLYKLRQEWQSALSDQSLIQEMQRNVAQDIPKVTPSDVKKYVEETPAEDLPMVSTKYRIRQIGLYPDKEAAELAVKEQLVGLRERIVNGERFSTLARLYSQDPGSVAKGGELGMASKSIFWPAFSDAAMSLKVGQVSQVVETPDGFHIIQLIEREGDKFNARHILIKPQYTSEDRSRAFQRLDSIRNLVVEEKMSFADAARSFSEERHSATSGGLMADEYSGSSYFEKDQLKPADYNVLRNMQEGDVSEPFESLDNEGRNGNTIYKILYLERVIPAHVATFQEDYNTLLEEVNQKNSLAAIDKFIEEKQKTTYIVIDPMFQGCDFQRKGWIK
ncbi:MAG: peptidylprolyl isomerase [Bacteroidales bacterium]|nr:peptidylprolyl isomerase [Bacteroidales bacterium]MBQ4012946.1 peptidylprolyl isomerase [Bacteroidales bacterium]